MNLFNDLVFNEENPAIQTIKKTEKSIILSVGLLEKQMLEKHTTANPATLVVVRGKLDFMISEQVIVLREGDVYEIPVNIEHEVLGRDIENIFLIIKEL